MARPIKTGLDYFPFDVDFFIDDKLQFISARFEEKGELIAVKLLCKIYKTGYFLNWDEDQALLFAKGAGRNVTHTLVKDVVAELVKRSFFDKTLFEGFSVLTSFGIQKRYIRICADAKRKVDFDKMKYGLFGLNEFPPELKPLTPVETPIIREFSTQRKGKESKVKETNTTHTPAEIKVDFLADIGLLESWKLKRLEENEFEKGIDVFLNQQLEAEYFTWQKLRQHFIYWMKNYPKAVEGFAPESKRFKF